MRCVSEARGVDRPVAAKASFGGYRRRGLAPRGLRQLIVHGVADQRGTIPFLARGAMGECGKQRPRHGARHDDTYEF